MHMPKAWWEKKLEYLGGKAENVSLQKRERASVGDLRLLRLHNHAYPPHSSL